MVSFSLYLNNNSYAIVDFGDGFLDSFDRDRNVVNHAFASQGTYKVTAKVFADCGQNDTLTAEITVDDKIKPPSFFIGKFTDRVCPGEEFFIYSPYLQKGDTFKIDFGDGTSELISDSSRYFYHAYALSGLYTISAEHINVCGNKSTASASMIAGGGGNLNLRIETDPQKGEMVASCLNDTLTFNVYGDAGRSFRNVFWTFNDGDTASGNYVKTVPQNLGLFKALCTATDYCGDKHYVAKSIQITDHTMTPRALFWLQPEIDCIHKEVLFDNVSQDANKMVWDYGDGTTEEVTKAVFHQIHTYAKAQEYDVALTATNGCGSDVDRHHFNAIAGPIISISSSQSTVAQGDSVDFNFTVNEGTEFYWELPNGLVKNDKSITYTFDAIGRFKTTIWAKSVFGCWDSASVITQVGGLGMKNLGISKNEIILYPNPTTGKVFISTNCSADTPIFYEVIDNRGRVVLSGQMNETKSIDLDATALEAGLYWISLEIASERSIGRILLH
jgi:PKD repeat protein